MAPTDPLDILLAKQADEIRAQSPQAIISVREIPGREGARTCMRRAEIQRYPTPEITGFVEFPMSIFFAVLFTPRPTERRNIRKLEYLLKKVLPISVRLPAQQGGRLPAGGRRVSRLLPAPEADPPASGRGTPHPRGGA